MIRRRVVKNEHKDVALSSGLAFLRVCVSSHLLSLGTVAFDEVLTHLSFAGHVNVTIRTVAVVADSLQKVGTDGHLQT